MHKNWKYKDDACLVSLLSLSHCQSEQLGQSGQKLKMVTFCPNANFA